MQQLDRAGRFRAQARPIGLYTKEGGQAVQAIFDWEILEMWNPATETWDPWAQYRMSVLGYHTIIKNDGQPLQNTVQAMVEYMGWNSTLESIDEGSGWVPRPCQITVAENTYQGKTSLKVEWINDWNSEGGTVRKADSTAVKKLAAQHGAKLRAVAGNIARNAAPAGGPPPSPPPPPPVAANVYDPAKPDAIPF